MTICSYVLCVHSLITCMQLKKMSVMYESVHDAITFQFYHKAQPETISNIAQGTFFKGFTGKILAILRSCIMEKISLEVTCKRNRFGYWQSCKRLPNFVNVAALVFSQSASGQQFGLLIGAEEPETLVQNIAISLFL